jgi:type I restriction enzyme S subunit
MSFHLSNVSASVHARLLNRSHKTGEDFQFILQRYAAERFLYRLGKSPYCQQYVLKGASLFSFWESSIYRPTRDIDFTAYVESNANFVLSSFQEICKLSVQDDGILFNPDTFTAKLIRDNSIYHGLRVKFQANLGSARISMQIDVGFDNAIYPEAVEKDYPVLLSDFPAPKIHVYPIEAAIAEKLHALVVLGENNSRLKDFYDLYVFAKKFPFDGKKISQAVSVTFQQRRTSIDITHPMALAPRFFLDTVRATQWQTYLKRNELSTAPANFNEVGELLRTFFEPVWSALASRKIFDFNWSPSTGKWEIRGSSTKEASVSVKSQKLNESGGMRLSEIPIKKVTTEKRASVTSRFKPYPEYKDSGVEWLGEIPVGWEVKRLKYLATLNNETLPESTDSELEIMYIDISSVDNVRGIVSKEPLTFAKAPSRARRVVRDGDIIISTVRTYLRAIAAITNPEPYLVVSTGFAVVRPGPELSTNFMGFMARSPYMVEWVVANSTGVSYPAINETELGTIPVAFPPPSQQQAIADFLDRETAKIDALIEKKEKLIELLQEKRTAVISHAVTKGLNPNVPMKYSGVEWLGEIPAHWEVKRLKQLCTFAYGDSLPDNERTDGEVQVYGSNGPVGIHDHANTLAPCVIIGRKGSFGKVNFSRHPVFAIDTTFFLDQRHTSMDIRWLYYILIHAQLDRASKDSAVPGLERQDAYSHFACYCPLSEQRAIADFLDRETAKIDALVKKIREGIELLKEYRAALISAAVTGKIDVRENMNILRFREHEVTKMTKKMVNLEEYRRSLLERLEQQHDVFSKTKELSKIFDFEWRDSIKREIEAASYDNLNSGFSSSKAFMFLALSSPIYRSDWYQEIPNLGEAGMESQLTEDQKFDPLRSFVPLFDEWCAAFSALPMKRFEVERKFKELRANRFSKKFREFAFEISVLGFFAKEKVLEDIEIPDGKGGIIDGKINLGSRPILVEITHTSEEILSSERNVQTVPVATLIEQTIQKIRKKVASGRQLAAAKQIPCILFIAHNPFGSDDVTSKWAVEKCFENSEFSKLSGVVFSDSWKLINTKFCAASRPEVPLDKQELDFLRKWFGG